jgi:hypothetical protein
VTASSRCALWALVLLMAVSAVAAETVRRTRSGEWTFLWTTETLPTFVADGGFAFTTPTKRSDLSSHERPSAALVYENGQLLGPANSQHADIRTLGRGRFSFWHDYVYISTTDNTNPSINGRIYTIRFPPIVRSAARAIYAAAAVIWSLGGVVLVAALWRIGWKRLWQWTLVAARTNGPRLVSSSSRLLPARRIPVVGLVGLWSLAVVLVGAAETVYLTRTAQWTWMWTELEVGAAQPELGFGFVAQTGRADLGSHQSPQATALFENGVQLGLRNAVHSDVREVGLGRYSFWHDYVLFATSDNSDPRTNGRRYTMRFSPVSRPVARLLYGSAVLAFVAAVVLSIARLRAGAVSTRVTQFIARHAVSIISAVSVSSLILPAAFRSTPLLAPLADQVANVVLVVQALVALAVWLRWGRRVPATLIAASLASVAVGFVMLTVWAPHRTEGCHTNGARYPVWNLYCVAPDSASYYTGYTVGSTRQPLYPWFIDAMVAGTGFDQRQFLATVKPGAPRFESDPLFRVVRGQIVLLLAAALLACWAAIRWFGSPLPAALFLWLYDQQFFSVEEMNIVLTEPLVQAFLLLAVAAYAAFLAKARPALLLAVAVACGLAYLTRQAALFAVGLLLTVIVLALFENPRRWWRWCGAAIVVFIAFASVPDVYAFVKTGEFSRNQTNLQYQYRIAHAMQYATRADVAVMPDEESRAWLADAIVRRDEAHRRVAEQFKDDELNRMIYYIAANLYEVATPIAGFRGENKTPDFYMKVATPILQRHWTEYVRFSFRFWQFGVTRPGLARLAMFDFSIAYVYVVLGALVVLLRNRTALAAAALIGCHWGAVAIICLAAVPIPRMVNASEFLVVIAAAILVFESTVRFVIPAIPGLGKETA